MDPHMFGSVLFDIFGPPSHFPDYQEFCRRVGELRGKVSVKKTGSGKEFIRVHNRGRPIPDQALEYAHNWADAHLVSHAYK